ncbi:MAG: nucleotidyl transferase AbiEii/AbiGii toxin family protein [Nanoarchaeota archaeon]|nr:nucleotidyl transferase AbiEii/AbiGii toxin family protein [Nanoarchaeota archaeon]
MFEQYIQRENTIFEILQTFIDNRLNFILIGGYAISAYKHRFSVDADIVIRSDDIEKFEKILESKKFKKTKSKELKNLYSTKFARFEKKNELNVSIDLLVGGMGIRQTDSSLSFDKINSNSSLKTIKGLEKEIKIKIPSKELLIALKLQAGRLTDFRDIVALSKDIDTNKIKEFLKNIDKNKLKNNINYLLSLLEKKEFMDSFKGVFMEKKFDIDLETIKKLKEI